MEYEYKQPEAAAASGQISAPKMKENAPFFATAREKLAAFAMYFLAYAYIEIRSYDLRTSRLMLALFTLGFFAMAEWLHRGKPRAWESWVWLGCAAACLASLLFLDGGRVWGENVWWFLHIFAVWWALSRSGALLAGESGRLLPLDAVDGFVVFPFRHFFLRVRCVWNAFASLKKSERKTPADTVFFTALACLVAVPLFVAAANLLMAADSGFASLLARAAELLRIDWDEEFLLKFAFSLPVGAYLFGLLAGTAREERDRLRVRAEGVIDGLVQLRQVPPRVWTALLAAFCALYLLFFAVQGRYLFGAFVRALPEGFSVAEYARQGFFELCKVMAVNFLVLWLVLRTAKADGAANRTLCLVLLAESLLFAVIALSKLALYIDCFGFTPKRLQSTWLVCVLACGCVCAILSLTRGKKTFRAWMIFGAATLCALCLY